MRPWACPTPTGLKTWWVSGRRTRFLCAYLLGCTACFLLVGFRSAVIKQWMLTFDLEPSAIGHITTAWLIGKCVGLGIVWSNRLGTYDVCVMVTLLVGASWWTRQADDTTDLFIGYGIEGCGAVIFGWWAPVILMRVEPSHFQFWSTVLSTLNIIAVCVGGALYGALEPILTWRGIWMVRSVTLSIASFGILLSTSATAAIDTQRDVESRKRLVDENRPPCRLAQSRTNTCDLCWPMRRMIHYVATLISVTATIAVLEAFSYWGMLYLERQYHYEHTPDLQVKCGIALTLIGAAAIAFQALLLRWKGGGAERTKSSHRTFMIAGQTICCVVCVVLAQSRSLDVFGALFLGVLTPIVCMLLSSCCYLMGTTASPDDRLQFTVIMEISVLLLTQWLSPILFGYILDHAIDTTFFIFAALFLIGALGATVSACVRVPADTPPPVP